MPELGVHSEIGRLRKVIIHLPGLVMRRPKKFFFMASVVKGLIQ
jgi:arginine deiminase